MPICYKAPAIGQSLVDGQEVYKVKAPRHGKHDLIYKFRVTHKCDSIFGSVSSLKTEKRVVTLGKRCLLNKLLIYFIVHRTVSHMLTSGLPF